MFEILQSETFKRWHSGLKDRQAILRINARLERVLDGNFGDVKALRAGISELRIDYGPGYRVYFMKQGAVVIVLLAGGNKSSQDNDIERAILLAKDWKE
jgi:putative addiction module killer protein